MKAYFYTLSAAAAFAAALLPAHAADLGAPVPEVPQEAPTLAAPAPVLERVAPRSVGLIDWSGAYIGVQAGGVFAAKPDIGNDPITRRFLSNGREYSGFVGGGHVGFDYQVGTVVVGLIGDVNYNSVRAKSQGAFNYVQDGTIFNTVATGSAGLDYDATVRARLGYAGLDLPVLPYVTGGLALAQGSGSFRLTGFGTDAATGVTTPTNVNLRDSRTNVGFAVGAGLDYQITDQVRARVEYLYKDLSQTRYFPGVDGGVDVGGHYNTVTGGLSYRW